MPFLPKSGNSFLAMVILQNITRQYHSKKVLNNVDFKWNGQGNLAVIGENGSGKTTLLRILAGQVQPDEGDVWVKDRKIWGPDWNLLPQEEGIAYVSQHFALPRNYTVKEMLNYDNQLSKSEMNLLIEACHLQPLLDRKTQDGLSGGEKQRISVAVALTRNPFLLLLDEPFTNTDAMHNHLLRDLLAKWQDNNGISIMMTGHNARELMGWATEMIILQEGKILQRATPHELYFKPANLYAAGLLGTYSLIPVKALRPNAMVPDNSMFFFRPGHIHIIKTATSLLKGEVVENLYQGDFYLNKMLTELGTVWTAGPQIEIGETVQLSFDLNGAWVLQS